MAYVKKFFVVLFVLMLSTGIFLTLMRDTKVKDDILRTTLQTFGDELLAMVPEGEQKELLQRQYVEFTRKAEQEEVPPEKIENMAAAILNITAQDTLISADEAMQALELAPLAAEPEVPEPRMTGPKRLFFDRPSTWDEDRRRELADRLRSLRTLKLRMNSYAESDSSFQALMDRMRFTADSGLRVIIAPEIKKYIEQYPDEELHRQIHSMEQQDLVRWRGEVIPPASLSPYLWPLQRLPLQILALVESGELDSLAAADPDSLKRYIKKAISKP